MSGVVLAASALPQSTSSSWPSFSSAWVAVVAASFAVGCGVFSASSVLPPLCCSTLAFGYVLALLVFPAWLALDVLPVLAFSGLSLSADSVSLSGVVLAASALPKSTSSSWPSSSSAWVGMAAASLAVGCGVFLASSVLPPLCCLALAFGFVFAFRVFPAWPVFPSLLSSFAGCGGPL